MMAAARGIVMGFETMETEFMNTTEKAMKYVNLIDNPYLGVYPDSGNLTKRRRHLSYQRVWMIWKPDATISLRST